MRAWWMTAALAVGACDGGASGEDDTDVPPVPTVRIVAPADGETIGGLSVTVTVEVTDFTFTAKNEVAAIFPAWWSVILPTAAAHEVGEAPNGYVEVRLDDVIVAEVAGPDAVVPLDGVGAGVHTIRVELLYPDGDVFYPGVIDEISVTVRE